ncbi:hypothetical protein AGMMS49975_24380 [Clostridia bacterium]|nr:hypothetical protein AGMMS49975_24380 [Clostridia bacterium]
MNIGSMKHELCKMLFEQSKAIASVSNDENEIKAINEKINALVTVFDALNQF